MHHDDGEEERPLAWTAIELGTPVYSTDDVEVGGVAETQGAEDIFHGLVVRTGAQADEVFIPATQVASITNKRVVVELTAEEIRALPPAPTRGS
jgi:uncharacterized protein YrrD